MKDVALGGGGGRRTMRPMLLTMMIAGLLGSCTSSSRSVRPIPSARPAPTPTAAPSLVATPDPQQGFAIWPEDTPTAAARAAVVLQTGASPWRADPAMTATEFCRRVLEWPGPSAGAVQDRGYGSFEVKVTRDPGGPWVTVRLAKVIADRWWSVTYVQGSAPEGYTAHVRGSKVELGFDREGAASMDVEVRYGGRGVSRTLRRPHLEADLGFHPTTTGHFLILYRDDRGHVFSAFGSTLKAGDVAAS